MIGWLIRRWRNRPDPTWAATGYRYTTEAGYDERRATAGRLRQLSRDKARRELEAGIGRRGEIREWRREA